MPDREVGTVSWINVIPLNRRERLARWWHEDMRQGGTYTSERQRNQEFQSVIPATSIEQLACEGLRQALHAQKRDLEDGADIVTIPRATPDGTVHFGSVGIPSRPLGVRFTEVGVISIVDEDH